MVAGAAAVVAAAAVAATATAATAAAAAAAVPSVDVLLFVNRTDDRSLLIHLLRSDPSRIVPLRSDGRSSSDSQRYHHVGRSALSVVEGSSTSPLPSAAFSVFLILVCSTQKRTPHHNKRHVRNTAEVVQSFAGGFS